LEVCDEDVVSAVVAQRIVFERQHVEQGGDGVASDCLLGTCHLQSLGKQVVYVRVSGSRLRAIEPVIDIEQVRRFLGFAGKVASGGGKLAEADLRDRKHSLVISEVSEGSQVRVDPL